MSLRELALQDRVAALEHAVQGLAMTIQSHLPAAGATVAGVVDIIAETSIEIEKTVARTVNAQRIIGNRQRDRVLDYSDLITLLKMYVPIIKALDVKEQFLKVDNSRNRIGRMSQRLDLTRILTNVGSQGNVVGPATQLDVVFLFDNYNHDIKVHSTEYYQGTPVSYCVNYNPEVTPLFENEVIRQMRDMIKTLGGEHTPSDIYVTLNDRHHGVTLNHANWERLPVYKGETEDLRFVRLDTTTFDKSVQLTVIFNRKQSVDVEIILRQKWGTDVRLVAQSGHVQFYLYEIGKAQDRLEYSRLTLLTRTRIHALIEYAVHQMTTGMHIEPFVDVTHDTLHWKITKANNDSDEG